MTTNGTTCHGEGCTHKPVAGMSYCSEDHYEQLVDERKARNHYRSASPVQSDYTAQLQPPRNQGLIKPPKPEVKPMETQAVEPPEPIPALPRDPRWMRGMSEEVNLKFIADIKLPIATLMAKYKISETAVRNMKRRCGEKFGPQPAALARKPKPAAPINLPQIVLDPIEQRIAQTQSYTQKAPSPIECFDHVIAMIEAEITEQTYLLNGLKARRALLA